MPEKRDIEKKRRYARERYHRVRAAMTPEQLDAERLRCVEYAREYRAKNPKKWRASSRNAKLKHRFGITSAEYDALLAKQGGACAICGAGEVAVHPSGKRFLLCVDHCHDTGKVRGLLCGRCNRALGLLDESTERLRAAMRYLSVTGRQGVLRGSTASRSP